MTAPHPIPISVLVPVKNEASNLEKCMRSITWAGEVFVVDSHSTDSTAALAESLGARVVQFEHRGGWPKKKNWALEHLPFKHDWVLILDADEVMPPEAEVEVRDIVSRPDTPFSGYWINRRLMFMGRWLRHACYPNWNLRLFMHKLGRYEQITEADTDSGDNEVHEHVVVRGATGRLRCELLHYAYPSVEVFVEKHNRYSNWEARVDLQPSTQGGAGALQEPGIALRRRWRSRLRRWPFRSLLRFLYVYIWQRGFLDGREGYYLARLHGMYELLSAAKAYELRKGFRKNA